MHDRAASIALLLLRSSVWITWPWYGSGHALHRIICAHQAYVYNPDWNAWGEALPTSIAPPLSLNPVQLNDQHLYSVAHLSDAFGTVPLWNEGSVEAACEQAVTQQMLTETWRQWFTQWRKTPQAITFTGTHHRPAVDLVNYTSQPIVQLYFKDLFTIQRRFPDKHALEPIMQFHESRIQPHAQVLSISIEDLFWGSYASFMSCYTELVTHLRIQDPRPEQIWAFILYYRDRVNRTLDLDRVQETA